MAEPENADELSARLDAAHAAAERLVREAEAAARETGDVSPRGWASPGGHHQHGPLPELQALGALLELARSAVPPELLHQLAEALRQLLLSLRALIDYSLSSTQSPPPGAPEVEDIPID